ncbi:MAG: S8 family peptidase [Chloroflexota bacterium]|nr:S8 family peptidase [Chloroflexota bacterium]
MGNSLSVAAGSPWRRTMRAFMAATMALGVLGVMPGSTALQTRQDEAEIKAHPMLLQMAQQRPNQTVSVIVQKWGKDSSVEQYVQAAGGKVTKDLSIINAFAAAMPAGSVDDLAATGGVRWVSPDAAMEAAGKEVKVTPTPTPTCTDCTDTKSLKNYYIFATKVDQVWNSAPYLQGQGMTVAVVDSGLDSTHSDFSVAGDLKTPRVIGKEKFNSFTSSMSDGYGHGTHVAGIIAGNGSSDPGKMIGVAPKANLVNVKVSDDDGRATASDVVAGLQWVLNNKATYNIRVVNLSLNSSVYESYHTSPLNAAVEVLWFNGIVVVVSAGNNGTATLFPPANDPFVITVGAVDDKSSAGLSDDYVTTFSAYGTTPEGFAKPDLVAPGYKIRSTLADSSDLSKKYPTYLVDDTVAYGEYFKMSGTSMAAPIVAGAVALLLQDEPNLTPDQVKYRLKATAVKSTKTWPGYSSAKAGAGYLDVKAAVNGTTTASANTNIQASQLLWSGSEPITWGSVNWNSVNWNSVNWNSVNWNSVNWNSVNWNSTYWEP